MSSETTWFTFPDATLTYDCAPCGACCKGLGVGLDAVADEPSRLTALYPALVPFLRDTGGVWSARNPRGRCWFLEDDGLCRVERDHGRGLKPAACRLFPFNRVFRIGAFTVIDYNSVICPLRTVRDPSNQTATGISWQSIIDDLAAVADPGLTASPLPTDPTDADGRHFITRERRLAEAAFQAFAQPSPDLDPILAAKLPRRISPARLRADVATAWQHLTDRAPTLPSDETLRNALVLTPSMRFNQLYGRQQLLPRPDLVPLLPAMWLAWLHALADAEQLAQRPLTLQQATGVWTDQAILSFVVAAWFRVPALTPGPVALTDEPTMRRRLLAFADGLTHDRAGTLGARILAHAGPTALDKVVFARALEVLAGHWRFEGR